MLQVSRTFVVLRQPFGDPNAATVREVATLETAKRIVAGLIKARRGIMHANGRGGNYVARGQRVRLHIKRRRVL